MPGSVGNTGFAGNYAVRCCRTVSSDFEVIRLKIRLNFVAARNVPIDFPANISMIFLLRQSLSVRCAILPFTTTDEEGVQ